MAEYTPTTEDVRERFIDGAMVTGFAHSRNKARRGFDRWLAEVKAEALREAADSPAADEFLRGLPEGEFGEHAVETGRAWLMARADRIEKGANDD